MTTVVDSTTKAASYPGFPEYAGFSGGVTALPDSVATAADGVSSATDEKRGHRRHRTAPVVARLRSVFEPSMNRLSMKIYGSEKAVLKERLRQRSLAVWVIHPCSKFRCVVIPLPRPLRSRTVSAVFKRVY